MIESTNHMLEVYNLTNQVLKTDVNLRLIDFINTVQKVKD